MKNSIICRICIVLLISILLKTKAKATIYYVSNAGDNNYNGLTLDSSFLTIQYAADLVSAGDTVYVDNGIYAGFDLRNVDGTSIQPISFIAFGNNVILNLPGPIRDDIINVENADHIIIDGFTTRDSPFAGNGIRVVLSDFCIIRNNICDNNGQRGIFTGFTNDIIIENNICSNSTDEHGIYVSNSSDRPIIRYNECFGNNNIGIHMNGDASLGGDGIISDPQVYGNIIHDNNLAAGINLDGVQRPVIYNNLIYNNHYAQGIVLFQADGAIMSYGAKIYNNTIIVPSDGRWGINLKNGAQDSTEIYNNIIITEHAWRGCIAVESITGLVSDHNLVNDRLSSSGDGSTNTLSNWQALGLDQNSQIANTQNLIFADPNNNDFHLISTSQAVDAGTSIVSSIVNIDLDGGTRPNGTTYDLGSYEYSVITNKTDLEFHEMQISISPNPVKDRLIITGNANHCAIQITSISGQYSKCFRNTTLPFTFDARKLPIGVFFVEITDHRASYTKRIKLMRSN